MNLIAEFEDSPMLKFVYKNMSYFLDNPIRRWFNDPVKKIKAAGIRSGMDVLEVGCGSGYFTIPAAELVGEEGCLHAIDIHPIAIETVSRRIKESNLKNVILSKTNALETGLPNESYDLILLFGVIPAPVLPLERLLPEMHRLLKPEGKMAVWTAFPLGSPRSVTEYGLFKYVGNKDGVHIYARALQKNFAQQSLYAGKHFRVVSLDGEARKRRTPFSFSNQAVFVNCGCTRAPLS